MSARIEPGICITDGARISAEGHLAVRRPATIGAWVDVALTPGNYTQFGAIVEQVIAATKIATASAAWGNTDGTDFATLTSTGGNYDLEFFDEELAAVLGFQTGAAIYTNAASFTSDLSPDGRITLDNPAGFEFGTQLIRAASIDHAGQVSGAMLARRGIADYTFILMDDEVAHFAAVLKRILAGVPTGIYLDETAGFGFDLTLASWKKGRVMIHRQGGGQISLAEFTAAPAATVRSVSVSFIDCEVI
jgi:hypothetical protein